MIERNCGDVLRETPHSDWTHKLRLLLPLLGPADAIEGHVRGPVLPGDPEGGLGHLRELQVFGSRNDICSHGRQEGEKSEDLCVCVCVCHLVLLSLGGPGIGP